jgi:hypothetical protein
MDISTKGAPARPGAVTGTSSGKGQCGSEEKGVQRQRPQGGGARTPDPTKVGVRSPQGWSLKGRSVRIACASVRYPVTHVFPYYRGCVR